MSSVVKQIRTDAVTPSMVTDHSAWKPAAEVWIEIRIVNGRAIFDCEGVIHLGKRKNRKVTFCSDADCTLRFTSAQVFETEILELAASVPNTLYVDDNLGLSEVSTFCYVGDVARFADETKGDPKIVVP